MVQVTVQSKVPLRTVNYRINLLPWREVRRMEKKKTFLQVLAGVFVFAVVIIIGCDRYFNVAIDSQKARNSFLSREIKELESKISEISQLREDHEKLLARMTVIQNLQGNRPIIVRLFDEMAKQLAPGVFFTSLELQGTVLTIEGIAESNTQISTQLRNFTDSNWFDKPNVTEILADQRYGRQASRFVLSVEQSVPRKSDN